MASLVTLCRDSVIYKIQAGLLRVDLQKHVPSSVLWETWPVDHHVLDMTNRVVTCLSLPETGQILAQTIP